MKLFRIAITLVLLKTCTAYCADVPDVIPNAPAAIQSSLPTKPEPLNPKERKGTDLSRRWINKNVSPVMDENGKVVFSYGATLPTVVCAPLQICDIQLQMGEKVRDVHVGDRIRWLVTPATSGTAPNEVVHLNVKPTESGISTLLMVTTDRRTYHIRLVAKVRDYMPLVGFSYPEEIDKMWADYFATEASKAERSTIPETRQNLETLDFEYTIAGDAPWKPLRVYNDAKKTYIQMPEAMSQTKAPALLISGKDEQPQLVNYRLIGDRYVVDSIFAQAILIAGVGDSQTRITITHKAPKKSSHREAQYAN